MILAYVYINLFYNKGCSSVRFPDLIIEKVRFGAIRKSLGAHY